MFAEKHDTMPESASNGSQSHKLPTWLWRTLLPLDVAMISEINMASEQSGWWLDCGAIIHVCNNRQMFKTFETVDGEEVQMGNGYRASVRGKGTVELNFTSGK